MTRKPLRRGPFPAPLEERLWTRINQDGDCWLWEGAANNKGYGVIGTGRGHATVYVHRLVWMLVRGDPGDLHVLHRCDTPRCCRPDHLFLGTHKDNMRDMDSKFRCVRHGERRRLLTPDQEQEVLTSAESALALSTRLPISPSGIRKLRKMGGYRYTANKKGAK